ncbi:transcriptional regulator [Arthrobacter alpinus]|uniref:Transcriptional regulator n=1 Tax=Arthrobacter alpinus TaxID=656366 RepID=A0A0M5LZQ1_9MICC|nr:MULTISPECIES: TetR/AcrR family transcriptional regulator [Arthrobacter]ALE91907.1 transcriptional regulator [Arthrobacter alpinus]
MVDTAEPSRPVGRRGLQAARTRSDIVQAAGELFLAQGYVATTIGSIAAAAGVAIQTIYNSVGNKPALLSAVLDAAVAGPNAPATVPDFMRERTAVATSFPAVAGVLADWFVEGLPRSSAIFTVIAQAAAVDPAVAQLRDRRARQRMEHYREAAAAIRERGGLSDGMGDDDAAALIFMIGHPDTYASLRGNFGWSGPRYRQWVFDSLLKALS